MARGAVNVQITGDYSDKDIKRAIRDLESLQSQARPTATAGQGVTTALKGMAIAAAGLVTLGAVTSFVKDFAVEAIAMAQEAKKADDRLVAIAASMGVLDTVLGGTTTRLTDYAQELQNTTGISDETTKAGQAILLTFSQLASTAGEAGGMFDRATAALLDLSAAGFGDAETNAKSLGKALQDPIKGLTALGRQGITFTEQEREKVKALVATNQTLEAQNLIMSAVEMQVGGTAAAVATDFDKMKAAADDAQEVIGFALVEAIGKVITAFGGVDDVNVAMADLGGSIAAMVKTAGTMLADVAEVIAVLKDWRNGTDEVAEATEQADHSLGDLLLLIPIAGAYLSTWANNAADANFELERQAKQIDDAEAYWQSYIATLDPVATETRRVAMETQDTEERLKEMKAAIDAVKGSISAAQAWIDFRNTLADIREDVDKTSRSIRGSGQAARDNQSALLDAFTSAANTAQTWGERTGASADQVDAKFRGLGQKVVNEFVRQGFNRTDVEAFLGDKGIWTSTIANLSGAVTDESRKLGVNASRGIATGIEQGRSRVATAMSGTVLAAIQAGKDAAEIQSPSKKAANEIGIPIMDGIAKGMVDKSTDLKTTTQTVIGEALSIAKDEISNWDAEIAARLGELESSKAAVADWVTSTKNQLVSAFDLAGVFEASIDEQGQMTVATFQSGIKAGLDQFQWYTNVLTAIAQTPGSEQLVAFLQSQGVANGGSWGQALIDNGLVQYMVDNLGTVTTTADTTAQALVPPFLTSAQQSAQALYDAYVKDYGKGGEKREKLQNLMDRLAKSLDRTSTITIKTVYEAAGIDGKRAAGGPVMANKAYLVGERGPEVLVMGGQSGMIVPNNELPTASGGYSTGKSAGASPIYLTVNAGMGTQGAEVGRQIVEQIRTFERTNGAGWRAA